MRALVCLVWAVAFSAAVVDAQEYTGGSNGAAHAALWYNGAEVVIPLSTEIRDGIEVSVAENWSYSDPQGEFRLDLTQVVFDPDPMITYNFALIDFGTPSSFQLVFSQGIAATAAPGVATHDLAGSSATGASLTPNAPLAGVPVDSDGTPEIAVLTLSIDGGVNLVNAGLDLGPAATIPVAGVYGSFAEGPVGGPLGAGSYNFMRVDVSFGLGGGSQAFSASGLATIVTPEPSAALLLCTGLLFGALRRTSLPS
jgi:hypothetical protein